MKKARRGEAQIAQLTVRLLLRAVKTILTHHSRQQQPSPTTLPTSINHNKDEEKLKEIAMLLRLNLCYGVE